MNGRTESLLSFAIGMALAGAVGAHHSIDAVYDGRQQVKVTGIVMQFQFVNPHPTVLVEVAQNGGAQQWRFEMDNRSELAAIGFTSGTLKKGDQIVVTGSRGRTQPTWLYVRRLDRPADGFWYEQVGSSPRSSLTRE